jgi:hypothetical protein
MLNRKRLTVFSCLLFAFLVGGLICLPLLASMYPFSFAADEKAFQEWVASALPVGSTREEVERWLQMEGATISQIVNEEGRSCGVTGEKPYSTWNGTWGIVVMEFHFGRDNKLSKRVVYIDV